MYRPTPIFIFSLIVLAIAFDIYVIMAQGVEESISWKIQSWSYKFPMIPFSIGVLMGHFFWPIKLGAK